MSGLLALFCFGILMSPRQDTPPSKPVTPPVLSPDGKVIGFQNAIAAFEKEDAEKPKSRGQILFIGSSTFTNWKKLAKQMDPLPVINRGFGGSHTWELVHYMDQIVYPYAPKVIVIYCGANDIGNGESAEAVFRRTRTFIENAESRLPGVKVLYVSVMRALEKQSRWPVVDQTNALVREFCEKSKSREFLDINPMIFDSSGTFRSELFLKDNLHLRQDSYPLLAERVKAALEKMYP